MNAIPLGSPVGVAFASLPHEPIPDFDLSYVRYRVARENQDWTQERLSAAEEDYRLYLAQCKAPHKGPLSPGRDADQFWHAHILHTREYARDCQDYFGYFLHHRPFAKNAKRQKATKCCTRNSSCNCDENCCAERDCDCD